MKVSEAIDLLKKYPKDCEIYLCKDWEQLDDNGNLCDLYRLQDVTSQTYYEDMGIECVEVTEVIMDFGNVNEEPTIIG
jgi:hypothetical protein